MAANGKFELTVSTVFRAGVFTNTNFFSWKPVDIMPPYNTHPTNRWRKLHSLSIIEKISHRPDIVHRRRVNTWLYPVYSGKRKFTSQ